MRKIKIGVLTWSSSLNYGGILQAASMLEALRMLNVDPVLLNWWRDESNSAFWRGVNKWGIKRWLKAFVRACLGIGEGSLLIRQLRTAFWMKNNYIRSPYHFHEWKDVNVLGVDAISAGSDQVWFCDEWHDPRRFLMFGVKNVPAISYAASFGMCEIPASMREIYSEGFRHFKAISVREKSGVGLVISTGHEASHVADPTLLLGFDFWRKRFPPKSTRRLVCYLISSEISGILPSLEKFARLHKCCVEVFVDALANPFSLTSPRINFRRWMDGVLFRLFSPVRLRLSAGPHQFVKSFSEANWILSDSFHGLMFATIFEKNIRLIRPTLPHKIKMFSRINDFCEEYIEGKTIVESLDEALLSFKRNEAIKYRRNAICGFIDHSQEWLSHAVSLLQKEVFNAQ